MYANYRTKLLASLALGAFMGVALGSMPAKADDTSAEIAVLKAELRRLEAKVDAQSKANAQTPEEGARRRRRVFAFQKKGKTNKRKGDAGRYPIGILPDQANDE